MKTLITVMLTGMLLATGAAAQTAAEIIEETTWADFAALSPRCAEGIEIIKEWYGV